MIKLENKIEAIYDALIFILQTHFIYKPLGEWNPNEIKTNNKIAEVLIEKLKEERDTNNE